MADLPSPHAEWVARIQAEIREVIAEREALSMAVAAGGSGLLIEPRGRRGQLCKRTRTNTYSEWFDLDGHAVYYHERLGRRERRWQTPRTPELVGQLESLVGRVARLRAESMAAGWAWEPMVKAAITEREAKKPPRE